MNRFVNLANLIIIIKISEIFRPLKISVENVRFIIELFINRLTNSVITVDRDLKRES